ncbi:hypothetical protein ATK74_0812 [Propionicimonas paludicola]|uniref:Uncharacterized protein n=1 Tax=Propionicimonas paludicola TaxID=185243 RepID=A0A2A9CPK5_9ACTN|nr:hypothetical protein [Propionicimonas paludicola]PFG16278.1 hypothetical protein ATK74_0812 [Propionicimonas paludicola]
MQGFGPVNLNMAELVEISNLVNREVCNPIGEQVLARAQADADGFAQSGNYRDTLRLEPDVRDGVEDWAHTRVVSGARYGHIVEAKHGTLARALGSA